MRALDGFSEKQARDGNHDRNACSRALVNESNSLAFVGMASALQNRFDRDEKQQPRDRQDKEARRDFDPNNPHAHKETGMGQRDKMALASIAFCSPLMLLAMGSTMAMMDDFRLNKEAKIEQSLRNRLQLRQGRLITEEVRETPKPSLSMSFDANGKMRVEATAIKPRKDKTSLQSADRPTQFLPMPDKSWLKASKLLKQKAALQDILEKGRGQMQLSKVSELVTKIEELDKALKQMGC